MALGTYSELQTAVASWLARTDLTANIPDFITLAEARINRELRCREMVTTATGSASTQALDVPDDFAEVVRLTFDTDTDLPLEYRPFEDSESRVAGITSGQPKWFSVVGDEFRFYPSPDGTYDYTLDYYAKVAALTDDDDTNWLLTKAPDLYLFGAMAEASAFLLDEAREQYWDAKFQKTHRSLMAAEARAKRTSGPRRMRALA